MRKSNNQLRRANHTLALLRREIVSGRFPAGAQLPTRLQLIEQLQVSPVTLQRALDRLADEGFVYSRGRGGTFVTNNPPHLSRIALVFAAVPSNDVTQWSVLSRLLSSEAPALADRSNRKISLYYGIDGHADNEDYQTLVRDVRARRLAGLLFASRPWQLRGTPVLEEPGVPRVAITSKLKIEPTVESVCPDWDSFFGRALEHFASQGRKRVAMLLKPQMLEDWDVERKIAAAGLETRPYWQLIMDSPLSVRNCLHLMLNPNQHERPDALLVSNDGWAEYAVAGLVAAGVRVPDDVEVVGHCNFPSQSPNVLPIRRLGWESRSFLETAMDCLDAQRASGTLGEGVRLPAIFEDEIHVHDVEGPAGKTR